MTTVHASSLVRFFCFVTMVAIWLSGVQAGLAGSWSAIGFLGVIFLFTSRNGVRRQPLILLLSFMLLFYFGMRLWDLYVFDLDVVASFQPVGAEVKAGLGGKVMPFAMISCMLMYSGLVAAGSPKVEAGKPPYSDFEPLYLDVNKELLFKILLACVLLEGALNYGYLFIRQAGFAVRLVSLIAQHELLLPLAAIAFARSGRGSIRLYIILAVILVSSVSSGERSGPIDILEIMLAWAVIPGNWNGTFKVNLRRVLLAAALVVMSLVTFVAATALRQSSLNVQAGATSFSSMFASSNNFSTLIVFTYEQIAYRVGTNMDALFWVFSQRYDSVYANAHVNVQTVIQTTLRTLFFVPVPPGVGFDEFEFAKLLGNRGTYLNGEFVPTGYSWGIFAYFYQICGYWAWPVLFGLFLVIGAFFQKLTKARATLSRDLLLYCIAHLVGLLVPMFGVGNLLGRYRGLAVTFVAIACLIPLVRKRPLRRREDAAGNEKPGLSSPV